MILLMVIVNKFYNDVFEYTVEFGVGDLHD